MATAASGPEVMSSSALTDHLSVGAGVGIDMPCLEGSVSVHYDQDVIETSDLNKALVTMSYCASTVALMRPPELSPDAFDVLYGQGIDAFSSIYGDSYVGGYRIGGDTSVLFSTDASSRSESERKRVNIDVEIWLGRLPRGDVDEFIEHGALDCGSCERLLDD
ncbi:hypothetical protein V8C34DRAFT_280863 [Trichoderma compactum]